MKSICIATPEIEPVTRVGGIGTHYSALTKLLSKNGWDVTVLLCPQELTDLSRIVDENRKELGPRIYDATALGDINGDLKSIFDLQYFSLKRSQIMHRALQALTNERGREFDLIEFPELGGTGFMVQRDDAAVLSSYFTTFTNDEETKVLDSLKPQRNIPFTPPWHWEPIGPCLPALLFENTQGDANSIYRTEAVRTVDGWPENKNCPNDYGLFLKLAGAGYILDVIPEVLYYFRVHEGNLSTQLKKDPRSSNAKLALIESIIQSHPELITLHYRSLHKLAAASQTEPKSALNLLNSRLAEFSAKSPKLRRLLESSGKILRKAIESDSE